MKTKIISLLKSLCVLSLPLLLTACESASGPSGSVFSVSANDTSLQVLSSIFGKVDSIVSGGSTVFQTLMLYFNLGLASVVSIVFGYSVFQYTVKGSVTSAMQNTQNAGLTLARISIGLALMLPLAGGYSAIQRIVLVVVEQSVGIANSVYNAVQTSEAKKPIFNTSALMKYNQAGDSGGVGALSHADMTNAGQYAGTLFLIRANQWIDYLQASKGTQPNIMGAGAGPFPVPPSMSAPSGKYVAGALAETANMFIGSQSKQWACFAILYHAPVSSEGKATPYSDYIASNVKAKPNLSQCSSMAAEMDAKGGIANVEQTLKTAVQATVLTQAEILATTLPGLAAIDNDAPTPAAASCTGSNCYTNSWIHMGVEVLKLSGSEKTAMEGANSNPMKLPQPTEIITDAGNLTPKADIKNLSGLLDLDGSVSSISLQWGASAPDDTSANHIIGMKYSQFSPDGDGSSMATDQNKSYLLFGADGHLGSQGDLATHAEEAAGELSALSPINPFMAVLQLAVSDMAWQVARSNLFADTTADSHDDPFKSVHSLGIACFAGVQVIWASMVTAMTIFSGLMSYCSCESPGGNIASTAVAIVRPLISLVMLVFLLAGVVFAYWLPIFPAILFAFMVIGWVISVVEAMVSAPLICLGLTHPDDHDLLGKAEQGTMLLISIFLRPALMVIGMAFALALSYAGIFLLNRMLAIALTGGASNNLNYGLVEFGAASTGLRMIVIFPGIMLVYAIMVYNVITYCFGAAPDLVKYVNKWIGIPEANDYQVLDMAKSTLGPMTKIAGAGAEVMGSGAATTGAWSLHDEKKSQAKAESAADAQNNKQ
jgi:conjugal transfer/type IV secretion protein DotA/TraY